MKYINYLDIPNLEKHKADLLYFYDKVGDPKKVWWCYFEQEVKEHIPEFFDMWKQEYGITLHQLIYFVNYQNDINITDPSNERCIFIHVDAKDSEDQGHDLPLDQRYATKFVPVHAINIPLINCEGSQTIWYKEKEIKSHSYYPTYGCGGLHPDNVEEIFRAELHKPAILNVGIPHGVYVPKNSPRIVATMRFKEPLDFLMQK
jgi:hypothetical protein